SVREVVALAEKILGERIEILQRPERIRAVERMHLLAGIERIRAAIGWEPEIPFEQGLRELLRP
ncbi:MAG: NAD(P)-dependent oxidoreductase, partial [Deltaproteobacteria bacterium]